MGQLSVSQWQTLSETFGLTTWQAPAAAACIDAVALLDIDRCRDILDRLGPIIGSPSRAITASLLCKRLAFLTTGPSLYGLSVFDQCLDFRIENCVTDYAHHDGAWRSRMPIHRSHTSAPDGAGRDAWRERMVRELFAGHLTRLWQSFHLASGIAPRILWENTAVRVYSLYERRIAKLACATRRAQAAADFHYLVTDAPASVFGIESNPLSRYFFAPTVVHGKGDSATQQIRFRKTCCLYFKATCPPEYCTTCPLLLPRKTRSPHPGG